MCLKESVLRDFLSDMEIANFPPCQCMNALLVSLNQNTKSILVNLTIHAGSVQRRLFPSETSANQFRHTIISDAISQWVGCKIVIIIEKI